MKTLQPTDTLAGMILGDQKIYEAEIYRLASYCMAIYYDDHILIFNNLTKKYVAIAFCEFEESGIPFSIDDDYSNVNILNFKYFKNEIIDSLIGDYFFVTLNTDTVSMRDSLRETVKALQSVDKDIYAYVIYTTTACNARCFYCFEAGIETQTMTAQTAQQLAQYILDHSGEKRVFLRWFGGEPLCNKKAISIISDALNAAGKSFYADIVTNGYLIDDEVVQKSATDWHINNFQITIDGLRDTYNRVKAYVNGDPNAYDRVLNNIEKVLQNGMEVDIRLNLDLYNADELIDLVNEIGPRFKKYKKACIYTRPIYENIRACKNSHDDKERALITKKYLEIEKLIDSFGMRLKGNITKKVSLYSCMADQPYCYLVTPKGKFGYCEHYPLEYNFGSLSENNPRGTWSSYIPALEKCAECAAYPTCIRLLDCKDGRTECFEYEQILHLWQLREGMKKKYNQEKGKL